MKEGHIVTTTGLFDASWQIAKALEDLVRINEEHNAAISKIIGHPLGWKDDYLNAARDALSSWHKATGAGYE